MFSEPLLASFNSVSKQLNRWRTSVMTCTTVNKVGSQRLPLWICWWVQKYAWCNSLVLFTMFFASSSVRAVFSVTSLSASCKTRLETKPKNTKSNPKASRVLYYIHVNMAFCMSSTSFLVSFSSLSKELARCPTSASSCRNMSLTSKQHKYSQHCTQRTRKSNKGHTVLGQNGLLQICWNNALYVCSAFWLAQLFQCLTNAVRNGQEHSCQKSSKRKQHPQGPVGIKGICVSRWRQEYGVRASKEQTHQHIYRVQSASQLRIILYIYIFIDTWRVHHLGQQQ